MKVTYHNGTYYLDGRPVSREEALKAIAGGATWTTPEAMGLTGPTTTSQASTQETAVPPKPDFGPDVDAEMAVQLVPTYDELGNVSGYRPYYYWRPVPRQPEAQQGGYATRDEAEAALAQHLEASGALGAKAQYEVYQDQDTKRWYYRQRGGYATSQEAQAALEEYAKSAGADSRDYELYQDQDTGRWYYRRKTERPPTAMPQITWDENGYGWYQDRNGDWVRVNPQDLRSRLEGVIYNDLISGDPTRQQNALAMWDFLNQPNNLELAQFALQAASSPADYFTIWAIARGEAPVAAQGPFGRIAPNAQWLDAALGRLFRWTAAANLPFSEVVKAGAGQLPPASTPATKPWQDIERTAPPGETPPGAMVSQPEGGSVEAPTASTMVPPAAPPSYITPPGFETAEQGAWGAGGLVPTPVTPAPPPPTPVQAVSPPEATPVTFMEGGGGVQETQPTPWVSPQATSASGFVIPSDYDESGQGEGGLVRAPGAVTEAPPAAPKPPVVPFAAPTQPASQPTRFGEPLAGLPTAIRQAYMGQTVAPVARQFPAMGGPPFPSPESWRNMLPSERAAFQRAVQMQGIPWEDYAEQMRRATLPTGRRYPRSRLVVPFASVPGRA